MLDECYPEIEKLSASIRDIEAAHGLATDHYWLAKDAPNEYRILSTKWDVEAQKCLSETLTELEEQAAASLFKKDQGEFDRLCEPGRRSFHHNEPPRESRRPVGLSQAAIA